MQAIPLYGYFVAMYGKYDPIEGKEALEKLLPKLVDLSPRGILNQLQLQKPMYTPTATYGHFGREAGFQGSFTWERTDLADELKSRLG